MASKSIAPGIETPSRAAHKINALRVTKNPKSGKHKTNARRATNQEWYIKNKCLESSEEPRERHT